MDKKEKDNKSASLTKEKATPVVAKSKGNKSTPSSEKKTKNSDKNEDLQANSNPSGIQETAIQTLSSQTEGQATKETGNKPNPTRLGVLAVIGNDLVYKVNVAELPREALEEIAKELDIPYSDDLTDKELSLAILKLSKAGKKEEVPGVEKLTDTLMKEIDRVADALFAKRNVDTLYFTSDVIPFKNKNDAKKHAIGLDNKVITKRTKIN